MEDKKPGLNDSLTEEEYQELLKQPRPDLDEALERGIRERDAESQRR